MKFKSNERNASIYTLDQNALDPSTPSEHFQRVIMRDGSRHYSVLVKSEDVVLPQFLAAAEFPGEVVAILDGHDEAVIDGDQYGQDHIDYDGMWSSIFGSDVTVRGTPQATLTD